MSEFRDSLTDEEYWHFLISFGKNASTYKPVWGKVIADYGKTNSDKKIRLFELSEKLFDYYDERTKINKMPQMGQRGNQLSWNKNCRSLGSVKSIKKSCQRCF